MTVHLETAVSRPVVAALDIGGTTIKGAVFDGEGVVVSQCSLPTFSISDSASAGVLAVLSQLDAAATHLGHSLKSIGIAAPGLVDSSAGTVAYAANLGWRSFAIQSLLELRYGVPVAVDHDARAAALAETTVSTKTDSAAGNTIFIPIGTGIAAAVISGGHTLRGETGAAGEFGHIQVVPDGDRCGCGQNGCLEAYASASSILTRYQRLGGFLQSSTPEIIANAKRDPLANSVWETAIDALATGISTLVAMLDPGRIIIGGGLSLAGEALLAPLRQRTAAKLGWRTTPPLLQSALGVHAGLIGAALLTRGELSIGGNFCEQANRGLSIPAPEIPHSAGALQSGSITRKFQEHNRDN